jgi:hypothetical protein
MCTSTTTSTDAEPGRVPEPAGDWDEADTPNVAPEAEEVETDEAGYGYGV